MNIHRPHTSAPRRMRRGLSLVEMILALAITGMVAAAIAGMLSAVNSGTHSRRDARTAVLTSNAMATRVAGYVVQGRAFLAADDDRFVLWLNDDRQSESVHASEIRWFELDGVTGEFIVLFQDFPEGWTQTAIDLEDREHPHTTDWWALLRQLQTLGWVDSLPLADSIADARVRTDHAEPLQSRHLTVEVDIDIGAAPVTTVLPTTLLNHQPPVH